jgi:hypothetical protein
MLGVAVMTPETQALVKVAAGTALVIALVITFLERWFRPSYLMLEQSRRFPSWIGWFGWGLATVATLAYVLIDVLVWRGYL